ncbi:hypothetical protein Hthe01_18960 [Hydrogenophilus thermoluteolus]|uniref:hypothetical protein n=1 Tax=Hydrogenophilus thermoluteolus TaxID=297 RepID=UPI0024A5F754|nr:hypothetical protein [Hydrogenophilus thermoluteolus]GLW61547.1 hypothetical protein Hthe01_18960 [Hydrogenophilus thermoluteolus]
MNLYRAAATNRYYYAILEVLASSEEEAITLVNKAIESEKFREIEKSDEKSICELLEKEKIDYSVVRYDTDGQVDLYKEHAFDLSCDGVVVLKDGDRVVAIVDEGVLG